MKSRWIILIIVAVVIGLAGCAKHEDIGPFHDGELDKPSPITPIDPNNLYQKPGESAPPTEPQQAVYPYGVWQREKEKEAERN